jgi:5'-phosphate synthase pdxT subunit
MVSAPVVGVLALQGDVREHERVLEGLGARVVRVRREPELREVGGLVIPGGESSVIDKLARSFGVRDAIVERIRAGMPVYGTCAGLILLADRIADGIEGQQTFGGLDATVRRNAFGRQTESFEAALAVPALGEAPVHAAFIRAPVVEGIGAGVDALATTPDGRIVAVEQGPLLGTAFHPEVTGDTRFHARFLERVRV